MTTQGVKPVTKLHDWIGINDLTRREVKGKSVTFNEIEH